MGSLNLHHALKLQGEMFLGADIQRHSANVTLMNRSYHLRHNGITNLISKLDELLLVVAHLLGHHRYAGTLEELAHHLGLNKSIFLYLGTSGIGSGDDTRERHGKRHLVAEVDVSFFKELCHLGAGSMQ